jgi:hypothetical protein
MSDDKSRTRFLVGVVLALIGVAVISIVVSIVGVPKKVTAGALVACGVWAVGPPLWFLCEFAYLRPTDEREYAQFVYAQDLAKNLWAGVGVLLAVALFGRP